MPVIEHYKKQDNVAEVRPEPCPSSLSLKHFRSTAPQKRTRFTPQRLPLWRRSSYRLAMHFPSNVSNNV